MLLLLAIMLMLMMISTGSSKAIISTHYPDGLVSSGITNRLLSALLISLGGGDDIIDCLTTILVPEYC